MPNFSSKNEGTWFFFDDSNEKLGGICIKLLSPNEEEELNRLTIKKKMKPIRGIMQEIVTTNDKLRNELLYDIWIQDWKCVQLDDREMECTKANKLKMMQCTDFAKFILDKLIDLGDRNRAIEEARVKNLMTSSAGSSADSRVKDV